MRKAQGKDQVSIGILNVACISYKSIYFKKTRRLYIDVVFLASYNHSSVVLPVSRDRPG